tara:strand:+ start:49 stop:1722 length:1674 start_codon:yes stop_codon:yes gene_type:complete
MQEYEIITMPDKGIGSFLTSNVDEFEDNEVLFGNTGGINSIKEVADRMAAMGNGTDTYIIHASDREVILPREVGDKNPELVARIKSAIDREGGDGEAYVVGSNRNNINSETGLIEMKFSLSKFVRKVKNVVKKAAKIILPVAINFIAPGLGTVASAAIGAGIGGLIQGESIGDALKSAALGGITAGVASGISGAISGEGFIAGVKGGLPASYSGSGLKGAFPSYAKGDFALRKAGDPMFMGTGFRGTEDFTKMFPVAEAATPLTTSEIASKVNEITTNNPNISSEVAYQMVKDGNALAAAGGKSSLLGTAVKVGIPSLLAASAAGAFDPIEADQITEIAGTDITDMSDPANPIASTTAVVDANEDAYRVGVPGPIKYFTPSEIVVPPATLYGPDQGSIASIYSNLVPTGAGTNVILPSAATSGGASTPSAAPTEMAEVVIPGYDPRITGMRPAPIYGVDEFGNPIMSPYAPTAGPARFVGSDEVRTAASGGAMNFPRRTGQIEGPGTGTSDDIPAMLSDGEFVMTAKAVKNAGGGSREQGFRKMYDIMRSFEGGAVA